MPKATAWARPGPSHEWWLWLGPSPEQAKAASGQAKAGAFGPSQAGTSLNYLTFFETEHFRLLLAWTYRACQGCSEYVCLLGIHAELPELRGIYHSNLIPVKILKKNSGRAPSSANGCNIGLGNVAFH
jgi:hypothetical protein